MNFYNNFIFVLKIAITLDFSFYLIYAESFYIMAVQPISLKNTPLAKQTQNYTFGATSVSQNSAGDSVEFSNKKKENKTLKYSLGGIGALLGIIAIIKHKSISKLFKKASEIKPDTPKETASKIKGASPVTDVPVAKNTLLPLEDVLKSAEVESRFVTNSEGKGYQLWHFTSPAFFKKFLKLHTDLSEFCKQSNIQCHDIIDLQNKAKNTSNPNQEKYVALTNLVKEKIGVDLLEEVKHYRFISQGELDAIRTKQPVKNINNQSYSYVTLCPDYGLSCDTFDYRVTFKNTPTVLDNLDYYHDTQYKNGIKKPYSYQDVEKVEKLLEGKWQEVEFLPKDKTTIPQKNTITASNSIKTVAEPAILPKNLSENDVQKLLNNILDSERKYKLSDAEKISIQKTYGEGNYSRAYIKNLCQPINKDDIQFMTKLANICDGKYIGFWKSNPDKLLLLAKGGTLGNKIGENLNESTSGIIIDSFKALCDGKIDSKALNAVIEYKQCLFEKINCTLTCQTRINKTLKFIDSKESLNRNEIKQLKSTVLYLRGLSDGQIACSFNNDPLFKEFDSILGYLNKNQLTKTNIEQLQKKLTGIKLSILELGKKKNIQDKTNLLTELIEKHGKSLEGIKLNRVERYLENSILSTIEMDGKKLSEVMSDAINNESLRIKVSDYLGTEQPTIEKDSFMSTSLAPFNAFNPNSPVRWSLTTDKNTKGMYIEDLYNIFDNIEGKGGHEAEVLVESGSKITVKKAELKDGIWELEGIISSAPS